MTNTTLKQRIETALRDDGRWPVGSWGTPVQGRPPIVFVRYSGSRIIDGLRRRRVELVMMIAPANSGEWNTGGGVETLEDQLVELLNGVDDCYPELEPIAAVYDYPFPGKRQWERTDWVALIVPCYGP